MTNAQIRAEIKKRLDNAKPGEVIAMPIGWVQAMLDEADKKPADKKGK